MDEDERRTPSRAGWIGIAVAVAFLVGCVAFVLGERANEPSAGFGEVDRGFLADMTDHHDQAVEMAILATGRTTDPITESFVREIVVAQRWELGRMYELLDQAGAALPDGDRERTTMGWMGMAVPLASMPGYATDADLAALAAAEGVEVDRQFLELMRAHHLGGIHMAEEASRRAQHPRVRDLAARMARKQAIEVNEYDQVIARLGGG